MVAISDETGAVIERLAYDPWGKRRHVNGQADPLDAIVGVNTERGYTMHEHLDEIGVIHMNGRIYDPLIGRFMSADPFIQSADNLQSYNRYAYVMNNPLAYTDPSGYFSFKKLFRAVVAAVVAYYTAGAVQPYMLLNGYSVTAASIGAGMAGGFAAGAVSSGNLKGAVQGGISGGLFGWAGTVGGTGAAGANSMARYAAHAAAGCVGSEVGGGDCGSGALSAVVGKYTTNKINAKFGPEPSPGKFVAVTIAGGTASVIGGGKFDNGATTAAFGYLFNQMMSAARSAAAGAGAGAAAAGNGALDPETANRRYARAGAALDRLIDKSIGLDGPEEYQYRLIANDAGNYPSVRGGDVWLERGDTYKIGTSLDPDSRYARSFLRNLNVTMTVETTGNRYQVLAVEKMELMIHFATNLNLPPGNAYFK